MKIEMVRRAKSLKPTTEIMGITPAAPIYCDDHLSAASKQLLMAAKRLKKEGKITAMWVSNCNIMVKESDEAYPVMLSSMTQISHILNEERPRERATESTTATMATREPMQTEQSTNQPRKENKRTVDERSPDGPTGNAIKRTAHNRAIQQRIPPKGRGGMTGTSGVRGGRFGEAR